MDFGATWIGVGQDEMYALCKEYNVSTFAQPEEGKSVQMLCGTRGEYSGFIPPMSYLGLIDTELAIRKCDAIAQTIDLKEPWNSEMAEYYDSVTVEQFIDQQIWTQDCKATLTMAVKTLYCKEPSEISALSFFFLVHSGTNMKILCEIKEGAQQDRIVGGSSTLPKAIYNQLKDKAKWVLGEPVDKIQILPNEEQLVQVYGRSGKQYTARKCVVAVPPALAARIQWDPLLDATRDSLLSRSSAGSIHKCIFRYKTKWWVAKGLSGVVVSDHGPLSYIVDHSMKLPDGSEFIGLVGFCVGKDSIEIRNLPLEERKKRMLQHIEKAFESKEAWNMTEFYEHDWASEEFSRGCYMGNLPPGIMTQHAEHCDYMRLPWGNVYFAATEFSTIWSGYMEGAVRSGYAVAQEILKKPQPNPLPLIGKEFGCPLELNPPKVKNLKRAKKPSSSSGFWVALLVAAVAGLAYWKYQS